MSKKPLGRSGIQVPQLTFGGNVFGWTADEATSFSLLDALVANQLNFIDTADVYSSWAPGNQGGESETVIGNWLKKSGKRDQVIIATKVGKPMGEGKQGLSPRYIRQAVEDSLRRLQTDYIDLYQSHDDDQDTPLAETLAAFDELIKAGKVRAIGASNYQADRLVEALKVSEQNGLARYETLQPEYNLYAREGYEQALEAVAQQQGLGGDQLLPLASGFLTGKYRSAQDVGNEPAWGYHCVALSEPARFPHSGSPRSAGREAPDYTRTDLVGLADCSPKHHRANRQRHLVNPVG
ncbi:putative aldo-keto reductase [Serratia fonticola]|uniref:Putative aldo-keto reductase n=1 Tax=Serratia fonticola TaxID=47917 RepID=A0A4U9WIE7_SERFO|nr:putative aldo-keto reductase [Serratia fonticola]